MSHRPYFCSFLLATLSFVMMSTALAVESQDLPRRPNVVFILADDLGWSDTTLYGTTNFYRTPNLQRLASRGMTFTRAYSASPLCSPTRASILTGLAPSRHGITSPNCHTPVVRLKAELKKRAAANQRVIQPDSVSRLDRSYTTIAESLKSAGYATGHFGKWHLGAEPYSPIEHGFDVDVPHWPGPGPAGSYVAPWKFPDFDHDPEIPNEHIEDRMAKEAVAFMRQHRDEPFFLNYWMFSVHAPFDAKQELIREYELRVDATDQQRCPTYAAMIQSMDDAIGTLLDELDRLGISDQTIIIFASDNGGNEYNIVEGQRPTSNRPLRGGKATMHEGGVRTPAIIAWPNKVEPGSRSDAIIQSMDYYPTLLEMLDLKTDDQPFDGISLLPALRGEPLDRSAIFTYFPHNPPVPDWIPPSISVHQGAWKLIRIFHGGDAGTHEYRLFNLRDDIGEQTNLADRFPKRVLELDRLIEAHLQSTSAITPQPNPNFDSRRYDPQQEGVPAIKFRIKRDGKPNSPSQAVAGWTPGGTCELAIDDGALKIVSTGRDPYASLSFGKPIPAGSFQLKFKMASDSSGTGQAFWRTGKRAFHRDQSKGFDAQHDNQVHAYQVEFSTTTPIRAIRIDPARAAGTIRIHEVELRRNDDEIVYRSDF